MGSDDAPDGLRFAEVTPDRWPDFEALFRQGSRDEGGFPAGCWCMEWRLPRDEWKAGSGEGNRLAMKHLDDSGVVPGILAFIDGKPVGWCSVSPRETLRLRQRGLIRSEKQDEDVWSIICFFVPDQHRGIGVMSALLRAAVQYAADNGAKVVEGYPANAEVFPAIAYMGRATAFEKAGFTPIDKPTKGLTVMQRRITPTSR